MADFQKADLIEYDGIIGLGDDAQKRKLLPMCLPQVNVKTNPTKHFRFYVYRVILLVNH